MYELSQIILWRLRPVMAAETNLIDIIQSGFALFEDEETLLLMSQDPAHCAAVAAALADAALADAHAKLDLLIYLRACELTAQRSRAKDFRPNPTAASSHHTLQSCWRNFRRLVTRFDARERFAERRAECMRREHEADPLNLTDPLMTIRDLNDDGRAIIIPRA